MGYIIASIIVFVALFILILIQKRQIDQLVELNFQKEIQLKAFGDLSEDLITTARKTNDDCLSLINRLKTKLVPCKDCTYFIESDEDKTKGRCAKFSYSTVQKNEFCARGVKGAQKKS